MFKIAGSSFALLVFVAGAPATGAVEAGAGATCVPFLNGKIAFYTEREGASDSEIYTMNSDGSAQVALTNTDSESQPAWSPDGSKIAFRSVRDGNTEIYVMNADGSGEVNLTNTSSQEANPAWSPDGSRIAFDSFRGGNHDIYVMNADGSGQVNITNDAAFDEEPAWSPDGSRIAFTTDRDGNNEIYVMNADGSSFTNLSNNAAQDSTPAWSPDGSRIAFRRNGEVYVMNADSSNPVNLTNDPTSDSYPDWSPDGSKIVFTSFRDGNSEVHVMNADGSAPVNLTNNPAQDYEPDWQPIPIPFLTASNAKAKEGKPAKFKIKLGEAMSQPVCVPFETKKGKAKKKDFRSKDGTITFAPGETTKKIKVKTKSDGADERNETFFLEVGFPGGPADRGKAKIKDDD